MEVDNALVRCEIGFGGGARRWQALASSSGGEGGRYVDGRVILASLFRLTELAGIGKVAHSLSIRRTLTSWCLDRVSIGAYSLAQACHVYSEIWGRVGVTRGCEWETVEVDVPAGAQGHQAVVLAAALIITTDNRVGIIGWIRRLTLLFVATTPAQCPSTAQRQF